MTLITLIGRDGRGSDRTVCVCVCVPGCRPDKPRSSTGIFWDSVTVRISHIEMPLDKSYVCFSRVMGRGG